MAISRSFTKRHLDDPDGRTRFWLSQTPAVRLEAVEQIRQSAFSNHGVEQAFPRVYRITRKVQR
jgi:hypothetical protein